jgi:hypothetical protein
LTCPFPRVIVDIEEELLAITDSLRDMA